MDIRTAAPPGAEKASDGVISSSSSEAHMRTQSPQTVPTMTTAHHIANGRPSRAQFSMLPMRKRQRFNHRGGSGSVAAVLLRDVVSPIRILVCYPIVLWSSLAMGFAANALLCLNLTQAQVFGAPPFLFTPDQIGFTNFAFAAGAVVALGTAGPLSDRIALRRARANGGVLEAEMRLPALVPYVCANLAGMVVAAVGYQRAWSWEVIVIVGYSLVGLQVVGIPAIAIAYAVDSVSTLCSLVCIIAGLFVSDMSYLFAMISSHGCRDFNRGIVADVGCDLQYKSLPGEVMIAATIVKNTFGVSSPTSHFLSPIPHSSILTVGMQFGLIFYFNDWAARSGYISPVLLIMALTCGFSVLGLCVFIPWGKQFRRWTKDSKLHTL